MAKLTTRSLNTSTVSSDNLNKGSALTISEMDSNFLNLNTDKLETTGPATFTGDLTVTASSSSAVGSVIFPDNDASATVSIKSPPTLSETYSLALPVADGTANQVLTTNGSGQLQFQSIAGDITTIAITAGTGLTGSVTTATGDHTQTLAIDSTVATLTGSQTLTNKTLTAPVISSISNTGTVTLPTSTDTLVGRATTDTLTNKSIDADNNTITNLEVDNLKSGVLDTDISAVAGTDTTLASAKAIKTYVDAQIATKDALGELSGDSDDVSEGSSNLYFTNARADARISNNILDEDNFASDSATNTASQQSIKAYIATQIATKDNSDEITEGSTNLYFTNARADARFDTKLAAADTDNLSEGSSNLYHTTARARAAISASGSLSYNSSTGAMTYTQAAIDADSTTISNLEVDNLKATTLVTESEGISSNDNDTTLPTSAAVKDYVDGQIQTKDNTDEITEGSSNLYFTNARAEAVSINNVVEDTTPQLGGNLDVNGKDITSVSNGDVNIATNGTGDAVLKPNLPTGNTGPGYSFGWNDHSGFSGSGATGGTVHINSVLSVAAGETNPRIEKLYNEGIQVSSTAKGDGSGADFSWPSLVFCARDKEGTLTSPNTNRNSDDQGYGNVWFVKENRDLTNTTQQAVESNQILGGFFGAGSHDSTSLAPTSAAMFMRATEDFTTSVNGTRMEFSATANGDNSRTQCLDINGDSVVVNPDNSNVDFKVHGDSLSDIIKVDASADTLTLTGEDLVPATFFSDDITPNAGKSIQIGGTTSAGSIRTLQANSGRQNSIILTPDANGSYAEGNSGTGLNNGALSISVRDRGDGNTRTTFDSLAPYRSGTGTQITTASGSGASGRILDVNTSERIVFFEDAGAFQVGDTFTGILAGTVQTVANIGTNCKALEFQSSGFSWSGATGDLADKGFVRFSATDGMRGVGVDPGVDIFYNAKQHNFEGPVALHNESGAPSTVTDASHIYAKDVSSSSEVFVRDEAGNETQISPHNEQGEWQYYSRNIKTGKVVRVNMEKMIRDIEQLTGKTYIENE